MITYIIVNKNEKVETVKTIVITATPIATPTSDMFKDAFLGGCINGEATVAYCNCAYNFILKKVGKSELMQLGLRAVDEELTSNDNQLMIDAAVSCSNLYQS